MRIWHGLVAVLVVALLMPLALSSHGKGLFALVAYALLLCIWFGLHHLWWIWRPREGGAYQSGAGGCLIAAILFAYCLVTILVLFATSVMMDFWFFVTRIHLAAGPSGPTLRICNG